ncbi:MAG TPA: ferredoxin [Candidatus Butyricicoccus stercorigallinarum]|nr:ferredoxin [Candidatus Butyricicoccus stercorigallinarum]
MNVTIDRGGCIGCGQCAAACPAVFDMAEDGLAQVVRQPEADETALAQAAADGCPVAVIHVR